MRFSRLVISTFASSFLLAGVAFAQQADPANVDQGQRPPDESGDPKPAKSWALRIAPIFFWAPINSTTASEGEGAPPVNVTAGQAGLNSAFAARVEYQHGRWMVSGQEFFASVAYDQTGALGTRRELDFDISLLELYGGYGLGHDVSIMGGVRNYRGKLSYTSTNVASIEQDDNLTDPVVGVWYRPRLSKTWTMALSTDLGGFGVGFDLSSCGTVVFTWQFSRHFGADVGYRAMYLKKVDPSETLKSTFYGPVFGFELLF
jgi:hypothetical protein